MFLVGCSSAFAASSLLFSSAGSVFYTVIAVYATEFVLALADGIKFYHC